MHCFSFDIETVPDVEFGRRLWDLDELSDEDVATAMFFKQQQKTGSDFLPLHQHRIVAISVALRTADSFKVWSLGDEESDEAELVRRFFDGIDRYTPDLVSWNGGGFDLPVLHYRALKHSIQAPRYWEIGDADRDFRYNNYLSRFHWRHVDLMDVLSGFQPRARASLDQVALLLGFPGKLGMSGDKVWDTLSPGRHSRNPRLLRDRCPEHLAGLPALRIHARQSRRGGTATRTAAGARQRSATMDDAASERIPCGLACELSRGHGPRSSSRAGNGAHRCGHARWSRHRCSTDGKKVFVGRRVAGRAVQFMRRKSQRNYDEAELLEVLDGVPGAHRRRVRGVRSLRRLCFAARQPDEQQRAIKAQTLKDNLQRIGRVEPETWLEPMTGPLWNYRRRARLAVKDVPAQGRVLVGFRERHAPVHHRYASLRSAGATGRWLDRPV